MENMPDWLGLLIGALVVVLFSFERFNRANYEERYNLDELMRLLAPDQLRARTVVMRAYVGYTALILVVYLLVCGFSNVFAILGLDGLATAPVGAGASSVGSDAEGAIEQRSLGIGPGVSLTVALVMVGLAPSIPVLKRLEEYARYWAHRLAGIPTHVLNIRDTLQRREISLPQNHDYKADGLLIEAVDWKRMSCCSRILASIGMEVRNFERDILVIFASSSWILDNQLKLYQTSDRQRFLQLEEKLRLQKKEFVEDLDDLTALYRTGDDGFETNLQDTADDPGDMYEDFSLYDDRTTKWEKLLARADELSKGFCMLIALYVERGIIQPLPDEVLQRGEHTKAHWANQYAKATELLTEFTTNTLDESKTRSAMTRETASLFTWVSASILLVTFLWSLTAGRFSYELRYSKIVDDWYEPVWFQFIEAVFSFCLPLAIALTVYTFIKNRDHWKKTQTARLTEIVAQYFVVVAAAWFVTLIFVLGVFIWLTALNYGWDIAIKNVGYVLEYEAIAKLRGVALAILVIFLLDMVSDIDLIREPSSEAPAVKPSGDFAQKRDVELGSDDEVGQQELHNPPKDPAQERKSLTSVPRWILLSALVIGIIGFCGRYAKSVISVRQSNRIALDAIDGGLIFYSTLYSALVGLIAIYAFILVIRDREKAPHNSSQPSGAEVV